MHNPAYRDGGAPWRRRGWAATLLAAAVAIGAVATPLPAAAAEAMPSIAVTPPAVELPPTGDTVLIREDFSGGSLPEGWTAKAGTWTVRDGRLYGQGAAYAADPTRLLFGASVPEFRLDVTVRFESVSSASRWLGPILDHSATGAGPWQHAVMRANNTAYGFGKRNAANTGWDGSDILGTTPTSDPIAVGKDARISIVVRGTHGEFWYQAGAMTHPVKLTETEALARTDGGVLGLVLDGATASFDDIVVTDLDPDASACAPYDQKIRQDAANGAIGDVVFAETFDDTQAFDCWNTVSGDWAVDGGVLSGTPHAADTPAVLTFGPHLANYRLEAAVRVEDVSAGDATVAFGADAAPAGSAWSDGVFPASDFSSDAPIGVRIDVQGHQVSYYVDGALRGSTTLASRTPEGILGIRVDRASLMVDDISITKLDAPPAQCIPADRVPAPGDTGAVVAHRGNDGADGIGDNLIPGYARSVAVGADYWESDIHLTTDGVPVVRHDGIGSITLDQFRATYPGLPTLEEVLQFQRDSRSKHVLEYKGHWTQEGATIVRDLLVEYGVRADVVTQSFDIRTLDNVHAIDPEMPIMWLASTVSSGGDPVEFSRAHGLLGINPSTHPTAAQVAAMHAAGLKTYVWTQNSASQWAALTALGVDGIITDNAGAAVDWLATYNAERGLVTCRDVQVEVTGSGTASADAPRQQVGEPVSIATVPAVGHHLASISPLAPANLAIDENGTFTMPKQHATVRATFAANQWTIAYDANGGSDGPAPTVHTFGDGSTLAQSALVRDGFAFAGWATTPDATTAEFAVGAAAAEVTTEHGAQATIYAVWVADPRIDGSVPTIDGKVKVGGKVTAHAGAWTEGASLSYQWYAAGVAIAGATTSEFHIRGSLGGRELTVAVTGSLEGRDPLTMTSEPQVVTRGG